MKNMAVRDCLKACRRANREEEIAAHGRPIGWGRVFKSKKVYDRKKIKAADKKSLPYFLCCAVDCVCLFSWYDSRFSSSFHKIDRILAKQIQAGLFVLPLDLHYLCTGNIF